MNYDDSNGVEPVKMKETDFSEIGMYDGIFSNPIEGFAEVVGIKKGYVIPTIQYSIDKIFSGKIPAFDVNFINPEHDGNQYSVASQLKISGVISKWYYAIRNLAVVGLLCVLVYVGIRMVISSTASDKAKYKEMLKDWVIALCLLFFLHYIMAFTLEIVNAFNNLIGDRATSIPIIIETNGSIVGLFQDDIKFNTDLLGMVRLKMQFKEFTSKLVYMILYIGLLVYTVRYSWIYMKRTVTMMFLTLIAPLVALTYPIDKLNDGKAQAFNTWLKEYMYTALLQPFHLIIYTILMGSAMNIATTNPIYAIVVLGFMGVAEKMLRKFFGFDKASTPGTLSQAGAMFGGAAAVKLLKGATGAVANKKIREANGNSRTRKPIEENNAPEGFDALARGIKGADQNEEDSKPLLETLAEEKSKEEERFRNKEAEKQQEKRLEQLEKQNREGQKALEQELQGKDGGSIDIPSPSIRTKEGEKIPQGTRPQTLTTGWGRSGAGKRYTGVRNAQRGYLRELQEKYFGDEQRTKRTLKSVALGAAKTAGKVGAYTLMGAVGIGLGIGGEDVEDILTLGGATAALGGTIATNIGGKVANSSFIQGVVHNGTNQAEIAAQTERLYREGHHREFVQENFLDENGDKYSGKELNELEDRAIGHYNAGITDDAEIKRVMKLEDKIRKGIQGASLPPQTVDRAKAISETIGKLAKGIQPDKLSDEKYREGKISEFEKGLKNANPDLSDKEARANAKQTLALIMTYYKKP